MIMKPNISIPTVVGTEAYKCDLNAGGLFDLINRAYNDVDSENDERLFSVFKHCRNLQRIYKSLLNSSIITINGFLVDFFDDIWDFSDLRVQGKQPGYVFYFRRGNVLSDYYVIVLKLFVAYLIERDGINNGSKMNRFFTVRRFFNFLCYNNIFTLESITLRDIVSHFESIDANYSTKDKMHRHLRTLFDFYSVLTLYSIPNDINKYLKLSNRKKINALIEINKIPCPPSSFMKKYRDYLWMKAFDKNEKKEIRGKNGLLYLGTQSGLRGGELCILRVRDLEIRKMNNKKLGVLRYRMTKETNGRLASYGENETIANTKFIEMFIMLRELFAQERNELKSDLLVPNISKNNRKKDICDIRETSLYRQNIINCIFNASEWGLINSKESYLFESAFEYCGMQKGKRNTKNIPVKAIKKSGLEEGQIVSLVTIRQFRVYFASELHERGVTDKMISELLGHSSVEMWGYYVRPKHPVQEDIDFTAGTFREIIEDDLSVLGTKGEAIKNKIDKFIYRDGISVGKDLESIIDDLCMEMPVKQKLGGFCIKSNPHRECYHDAETDRLLCAYGCCPNHCHLYFSADISYERAKNLVQIIDYDLQDKEWINMAQKEAYKLEIVINQELLPELDALREMIMRNGNKWVIDKHSNLLFIVTNIDSIYEEISLWKSKIMALNLQ